MKKAITILLAASLMLSIAACGGGNGAAMSKEEMLAVAEEITIQDLTQDFAENKARAEQTYFDNIYRITGYVENIETDYCQLASFPIYFNEDVLATLNKNERITVVGKITKSNSKTTSVGPSSVAAFFEVTDAYYVENIYEVTGIFDRTGYANFDIVKDNDTFKFKLNEKAITSFAVLTSEAGNEINIYLEEDVLDGLNWGDKITVSGKMIYYPFDSRYSSENMVDAGLIE